MITFFRSLLFSTGFIASVLVFSPIIVIGHWVGVTGRTRIIGWWAGFNSWWFRRAIGVRYEFSGLENLPSEGTAIVMANHQSTWETFALFSLFPRQSWVLKRELLRIPVFGWGLALLRPIAIDRSAGRQAMEQVVSQGRERLEAGRWVLIFPEGTRVRPGQKVRYKSGGAILATRTGYPVLPIAHNAGTIWPKRQFLKRPGTIRVVIGQPIPAEGRKPDELLAEVEAWIRARQEEM